MLENKEFALADSPAPQLLHAPTSIHHAIGKIARVGHAANQHAGVLRVCGLVPLAGKIISTEPVAGLGADLIEAHRLRVSSRHVFSCEIE